MADAGADVCVRMQMHYLAEHFPRDGLAGVEPVRVAADASFLPSWRRQVGRYLVGAAAAQLFHDKAEPTSRSGLAFAEAAAVRPIGCADGLGYQIHRVQIDALLPARADHVTVYTRIFLLDNGCATVDDTEGNDDGRIVSQRSGARRVGDDEATERAGGAGEMHGWFAHLAVEKTPSVPAEWNETNIYDVDVRNLSSGIATRGTADEDHRRRPPRRRTYLRLASLPNHGMRRGTNGLSNSSFVPLAEFEHDCGNPALAGTGTFFTFLAVMLAAARVRRAAKHSARQRNGAGCDGQPPTPASGRRRRTRTITEALNIDGARVHRRKGSGPDDALVMIIRGRVAKSPRHPPRRRRRRARHRAGRDDIRGSIIKHCHGTAKCNGCQRKAQEANRRCWSEATRVGEASNPGPPGLQDGPADGAITVSVSRVESRARPTVPYPRLGEKLLHEFSALGFTTEQNADATKGSLPWRWNR